MNVRGAVAAFLLVLGASACSSNGPSTQQSAQGSAGSAAGTGAKAVCRSDKDCSPYHECLGDGHCRCDVNEDCATSQTCRAGICLPR